MMTTNTPTAPGERRYQVTEELVERSVGEDLLVHRVDTGDVFVLNPHARMVLAAVRAVRSHAEVQRTLMKCGFTDEGAMTALETALEELLNHGLITIVAD